MLNDLTKLKWVGGPGSVTSRSGNRPGVYATVTWFQSLLLTLFAAVARFNTYSLGLPGLGTYLRQYVCPTTPLALPT